MPSSSLANILKSLPARLIAEQKSNKILDFFNTTEYIFKEIQKQLYECEHQNLTKVLLRITQDVYKLHAIDYGGVKKITLLENPNKLHAELAVAEKLKDTSTAVQYIGISKLCCYLCNEILENNLKIDHRGTHGTLYLNGFKLPSSLDKRYSEELIEKIDNYRKFHWKDANQRITDNRIIVESNRVSEAPDLSDDEEIESQILINGTTLLVELKSQFKLKEKLKDIKKVLLLSECYFLDIHDMNKLARSALDVIQNKTIEKFKSLTQNKQDIINHNAPSYLEYCAEETIEKFEIIYKFKNTIFSFDQELMNNDIIAYYEELKLSGDSYQYDWYLPYI